METLKKIKDLLGYKGVCLIRTDESGKWFVHCWTYEPLCEHTLAHETSIYKGYTDDVDTALYDIKKCLELEV